jgi:arsenate reductase
MSTQDTCLYHNPRCSKSRAVKAILEERGIPFQVVHYLEDPLTEEDLSEVMTKLQISDPRGMMRTKESVYGEIGCDELQGDDLVRAMIQNRILIERPILVRGERAVIGRPPERVEELLD